MPVEVGCFQNAAIGIDHTRSPDADAEHRCRGLGDQIADQFHRRLVGSQADRILSYRGGVDAFVDPSAKVDESCPKGSVAQVDGDYVPAALIEGEKRRRFAARRSALAKFSKQADFDELSDQARDGGASEPGLTGDLGTTGCPTMRDEFQSGSQIAAAGIVFGGLGVSGQGRMRIALVQIASHHISSPAVDFLSTGRR
jgi:hypothetical protein